MNFSFPPWDKEYVTCRNLKKIGYKNETSSKPNAYKKEKEYLTPTPLGAVACERCSDGTYGPCYPHHPSGSHEVPKSYH